ncbi:uncharacterized protein LOC128885590 [Hylaeus anthracinus]|uniref:uncharacterized protein LOC128885590 n=1 Tax=Hylaeus anthracinus TaxID=313031 RepID=UPI0023B89DF7|nr:uncharacterized protein LOC128885590 [Hylaeus anthracinus]
MEPVPGPSRVTPIKTYPSGKFIGSSQKIMIINLYENLKLEQPELNRTSLYRLLKRMEFKYVSRSRNSAMLDKEYIVAWCQKYIFQIKQFRSQNKPIYYFVETWVTAGDVKRKLWKDTSVSSERNAEERGLSTGIPDSVNKGKRLIVLHIGSADGFVPGGLLCFESKKNSADYHDEMNGDTFFDWFQLVKKHKKEQNYVIDEYAKQHGHEVLRLLPYHCELNPIELAWAYIKEYVRGRNVTYKLPDVRKLIYEAIENVSPVMWQNFIRRVTGEENRLQESDNITDSMLDDGAERVDSPAPSSDSETESE